MVVRLHILFHIVYPGKGSDTIWERMHTWIERRRREPEGLRSSPAVNRAPETSCHMAPASAFSETLETGPPSLPEALEGGRGGGETVRKS